MKVGIGYCNTKESFAACKRAAEAAMGNGKIKKPDLVLAFCHNQIHVGIYGQG
jgi:hypothetical protein